MTATIHTGDALTILRTLPAESVHCVVTSPPYWALRDYGVAGQLGLEPTPADFLAGMVAVFEEVRRVLRDDGVCWVNMGDGYAGGGGYSPGSPCNVARANGEQWGTLNPAKMERHEAKEKPKHARKAPLGLKPKDLIGMPWRLAFALQDAGWWLRSDCIWHKPNPMPESCTDRPTKSHEYVFLLTKAARYFYDADAVREDGPSYTRKAGGYSRHHEQGASRFAGKGGFGDSDVTTHGRNLRTVWTISTQAYRGAHFATYPEALAERCILAGTSDHGCCAKCGAPWVRVIEAEYHHHHNTKPRDPGGGVNTTPGAAKTGAVLIRQNHTKGWRPSCDCDAAIAPCTVLDPFTGSGTTGQVAVRHARSFVGIELNPEYAAMARKRITGEAPLFVQAKQC